MIQAKISKNSCKSLYSAFERRFRYYKLFMIIHRLLVVFTFVFASKDKTSIGITFGITCIHLTALIINAYSRPFFSKMEDFLCLSCVGINTINGICTILLALGYPISELTIYIVGVLNISIPLLFVVLGGVLQSKNEKKLMAAMREEKEVLLQAIGDKDSRPKKEIRENQDMEFVAIDNEVLKLLDTTLDKKLLKVLVNFFLLVGITTFIGLCLAIFDVTYNVNSNNFISDIPGMPRTIDTLPFGPYKSWTDFTDNCCCWPNRGVNGTNYVSEVWKCKASQYSATESSFKSFIREYDGLDGYAIRGYCDVNFSSIVCIVPELIDNVVYPVLCDNATGTATTSDILQQLW